MKLEPEACHRAIAVLCERLRSCRWYHRTSIIEEYEPQPNGWSQLIRVTIQIWGTGKTHPEIPKEFEGWPVRFIRVTKKRPCPFGSVR
jgi:hypothetical protein